MNVLWVGIGGPYRQWWDDVLPVFESEGINLTVASLFEAEELSCQLRAHGVNTLSMNCRSSLDYARAVRCLAGEVRSRRIDVTHGVESIPGAIASAAGTLSRSRPLRAFHRQHLVPKPPAQHFDRVAQELADLIFMPSGSVVRRAIEDEHVPAHKVRLAYNGAPAPRSVHPSELAGLRQEMGIADGSMIVTMVTRLRVEKGVQFFLPAMAEVSRKMSIPVDAVIVGTGPFESELRSLAETLPELRVHWVGYRADVTPWFYLSDLVVVPSLFDALPFTAAEAMGCGRAVVASAVGGIPELIEDGVSGVLVPPGEASSLAAAITSLLTDPQSRARLGEGARARFDSTFNAAANARAVVAGWRAWLSGAEHPAQAGA